MRKKSSFIHTIYKLSWRHLPKANETIPPAQPSGPRGPATLRVVPRVCLVLSRSKLRTFVYARFSTNGCIARRDHGRCLPGAVFRCARTGVPCSSELQISCTIDYRARNPSGVRGARESEGRTQERLIFECVPSISMANGTTTASLASFVMLGRLLRNDT